MEFLHLLAVTPSLDFKFTFLFVRYGLFSQTSTSDRLLIPNASAKYLENGIQMIEFLGRVVGKALYEGILLDYSFSHVFVQKLLGRYSFLDELSTLDPELYRNLMYVKVNIFVYLVCVDNNCIEIQHKVIGCSCILNENLLSSCPLKEAS